MLGTTQVLNGRVVVFRQVKTRNYKGPKVGLIIGETDDGLLKVRVACGNRRYLSCVIEIEPGFIAREATEREAALGHPVGPVPPVAK